MDLPAPLTPPECDLRDYDGFIMNVERVLASELWALSTPEEFKAAFALWCRAWKQVPCASLPDDDAVLAAYSGAGKRWSKVKKMALRGFIKCFDGRLYHGTLSEDAMRAMAKKAEQRGRTKAATKARLDKKRDVPRDVARNERRDVERDVREKPNVTTSQYSSVQDKASKQSLGDVSEAELPLERLMRLLKIDHKALHKRPSFAEFPALLHEWKAAGCDLERDIWPAIERIATRGLTIESPRYFANAVMKARDDRIAAEPSVAEKWTLRLNAFQVEKFWDSAWGPKPDEEGCLAPADLIRSAA